MENRIKTRIILRHDSTSGWQSVGDSFVLYEGEIGIEFATGAKSAKIKIGDGINAWAKLPYYTPDVDITLPSSYTWGDLFGSGTDLKNPAAQTKNLDLKKPTYLEKANIGDLNKNYDKIDEAFGELDELVTLLQERMTSFITFPEPAQGTTQAEVNDIRIRADGTLYESAGDAVRAIDSELSELESKVGEGLSGSIPNGLYYKDNQLYLTHNDNLIGNPVIITGGGGPGGGGGGGYIYNVTLTNLSGGRLFSIAKDTPFSLKFEYTSLDSEGYGDGDGVGTIYNNGVKQTNFIVKQGIREIEITNYLKEGSNSIRLQVSNSEGTAPFIDYTINVLVLSLTTSSPLMALYNTDSYAFNYTIKGAGAKKMHFIFDGIEQPPLEIQDSGEETRTYIINRPKKDGAYIFEIYATSGTEDDLIYSERIRAGMIWYSNTTTDPIVLINSDLKKATQGNSISIPFMVFHPSYDSTQIKQRIIQEDGTVFFEESFEKNRDAAEWIITDFPSGKTTFEIICENITEKIIIDIEASTFNKEIYTDNLLLEFSAKNRQNIEINPEQWEYQGIKAYFENVGWNKIDGWLVDEKGQNMLRLLSKSKMFIDFNPFSYNISETGYTIEVEIATHNVADYNSIVVDASKDGRGFIIKTQSASLSSSSTSIFTNFKEDEKIRITFVIEKNKLDSSGTYSGGLIYIYINGILCGVKKYSGMDNFLIKDQENDNNETIKTNGITIGAESSSIDVYFIRFYNIAFTAEMQLNNFIVDRPNLQERIDLDLKNDILEITASSDPQKKITINSLKKTTSYIIIQSPALPETKEGSLNGISMSFIDPKNKERSFSATGCKFSVQGTSSLVYPVKNFKISFKNGIVYTENNEVAQGFKFTKNSLESKTLCLKADYASSEGANNVKLVDIYEQITPYKTPAQQVNEKVRQSIYGEPIVVFWENTDTGEIKFLGKYNMNDDKSNENIFGFSDIEIPSNILENKRIECWEWKNNNNPLCLFLADEFDKKNESDGSPVWPNDLEARFPDLDEKYSEIDKLRRMISWVVSTNPEAYSNNILTTPIYYPTRDNYWNRDKNYYDKNGELILINPTGFILSYNSKVLFDRDIFYSKMNAISHDELVGLYYAILQEDLTWNLYKNNELLVESIPQINNYGISVTEATITEFGFEYKIIGDKWTNKLYEYHTIDTPEYRLSKFKSEFENYFILDAMLMYYIFTEIFLMIDSRAKNMFMTTFDGDHWFPIPYDMDTAIGINNEGQLIADYNLEDTDYNSSAIMYDGENKLYDGLKLYTGKLIGDTFVTDEGEEIKFSKSNVYNAQDSVLWKNFKKCFDKEISEMYINLRKENKLFSSEEIINVFSNHQSAWAENIWNVDQAIKYLPYPEYYPMLQGNKEAQRNFWLFNAFNYRDSKYQTANAAKKIILRLYNKGKIIVSPYSHIYARVEFGNAKDEIKRAWRNEKVEFNTDGIASVFDLETHIYSADRISDLGDLSDFKVGFCDFKDATKISRIILGRDEENYANGNLNNLELGSNLLLNEINVSNCYNLKDTVDAGNCHGLEIFKARGSQLKSVTFPNGGRLKEIVLPETIVSLTLRNQTEIQTLTLDSYENLEDLFLENVPALPIENIILNSPKLSRVRLSNLEWTASSEGKLKEVINKLKKCQGFTETGTSTDKATVTARVKVDSIDDDFLKEINDTFPGLVVVVNGVAKYYVKYININREELYYYVADAGSDAIDPVATGALESAPTYPDAEDTKYEYIGWQNLPTNISQSYTIVAKYKETYRVRFYNSETAIEPVYEEWVEKFNSAIDPVAAKLIDPPMKATTAQYHYTFKDWGVDLTSIEEPLELYPTFNEIINTYTVKIFGGQKQLGEDQILEYGAAITLPTENVYNYYWDEDTEQYEYFTIYEHFGWDIDENGIDDGKELIVTPQQYTTNPIVVNALFSTKDNIINDSWEEIIEACESGNSKKYSLGMQKEIEFTYEGKTYTTMFEIVDYDYDKITGEDNKHASLTFMICNPVFATSIRNDYFFTWVAPTGETIESNLAGGFPNTPLFNSLNNIVYSDPTLQANIKMVDKKHDQGPKGRGNLEAQYYTPKIVSVKTWAPSATELGVVPSSMIGEGATDGNKIALAQGGDGTKGAYVWFTNNASRRKTFNGEFAPYLTRTYGASHYTMLGVGKDGGIGKEKDLSKAGLYIYKDQCIVFGFCI